jgi:hypothetical protein
MKGSEQSNFTERLKERMEQERKEIENLTLAELRSLRARLKELSSAVLTDIANDMANQYRGEVQGPLVNGIRDEIDQALAEVRRRTGAWRLETTNLEGDFKRLRLASRMMWPKILVAGLGTLAICFGIGWGVMTWLSTEIRTLRNEREELRAEIAEQKRTLEVFKTGMWGVVLHEDEHGRFVVLPEGAGIDPTWTVGERPAVLFWIREGKSKPAPPSGKRGR